MAKLIVIGSSSKGNAYAIKTENSCLLIEAGISVKAVKKALDFDLTDIEGCLISHSHGDHSSKMKEYNKAGIICYGNDETMNGSNYQRVIKSKEKLILNEFVIMPFEVKHDVKCFGYFIKHPEIGKLIFITDALFIPAKFVGVNHWLIEANYSSVIMDEMLETEKITPAQANRTILNHMSIENCVSGLEKQDLSDTLTITLLHLSDGNSDTQAFKSKIERSTGTPCNVADEGVIIEL